MIKRVAALYDIHGNLPALEAVLAEINVLDVDCILVGGDVFPGPMGVECLDALTSLDLPVSFIRGNGDRAVTQVAHGQAPRDVPNQFLPLIEWSVDRLSRRQVKLMRSWPLTLEMEIAGLGTVLFCHATPTSDSEIFTRTTAKARLGQIFDEVKADLVVGGHTHMQFDISVGTTRVINAGSVGAPYGSSGAYWVLLGSGVELRRSDYDLIAAGDRILDSGYPGAENFVNDMLEPVSESEILKAFSN